MDQAAPFGFDPVDVSGLDFTGVSEGVTVSTGAAVTRPAAA